jgi:hypothetical protein
MSIIQVPSLATSHGIDLNFLPAMWQAEIMQRVTAAKAHHLRLHTINPMAHMLPSIGALQVSQRSD